MRKASLDPARRLDLYFRINRNGDLTIPVYSANGSEFSLTYEDFQLFIKRNSGDLVDVLNLTVGSGINLVSNEIQINITAAQSLLTEGKYYWELINVGDNETWLCGNAFFHNGVFDAQSNDVSIEVTENEVINIYLS
jgi:hypothetical protein